MSERIKRINELIKHEIGQIILKEINLASVFITITTVDTSADLRRSKIKFIVYPKEATEKALNILEKNIYHIQQALNKRLKIKFVPKIKFEQDKAEAAAQRLEKLLQKIKK